MRETRFPFLYFLFYPILGPLLGFAGWAGVIVFVEWYNNRLAPSQFFGPEGLGDMYWMIPIAYVFGLIPAIITGIHAAKSLRKNGQTNLFETLLVSTVINLIIMIAGALAFGFGFMMLGVVLIPAGLFSVLVLKGIEKMFFQRPVLEAMQVE
ncbi:MAG: hypothetical protein L3J21_03845 [Devosiaceae bacterium]|nr:hypothetical protein [Devosiaceae bacterium]